MAHSRLYGSVALAALALAMLGASSRSPARPAERASVPAAPAAEVSMQDLSQWFRNQKPGGNEANVLGPQLFATMMTFAAGSIAAFSSLLSCASCHMTERVTTPLDKLEATGRADLERNLAASEACSRDSQQFTRNML